MSTKFVVLAALALLFAVSWAEAVSSVEDPAHLPTESSITDAVEELDDEFTATPDEELINGDGDDDTIPDAPSDFEEQLVKKQRNRRAHGTKKGAKRVARKVKKVSKKVVKRVSKKGTKKIVMDDDLLAEIPDDILDIDPHTNENAQLTKVLNDIEKKLQSEINTAANTRDRLKTLMDKEYKDAEVVKGQYSEAVKAYTSTASQASNEIRLIDQMRALMGQLSKYTVYAKCRDIRSRANFGGVTTSKEFTYSFWLKTRQGPTGRWRNIMHRGDSDSVRRPAFWLYPSELSLHMRVGTNANANDGCDCTRVVVLNKWQHVAFTVDAKNINSYIDGRRCCTKTHNGILTPTGLLRISDTWYDPVNGGIADVRVYSHAVSEASIKSLAASVPTCAQ